MKRTYILPLAMLLLAAAGALLPMSVASLDDARLESQVDARPLPSIHLSMRPEQGVEDALAIWSGNNVKIGLSQGGERSEREAREAAQAAMELLVERELLPRSLAGMEMDDVYPMAAVSDSESKSVAVIWSATLPSPDIYCQIFVDDVTGKLVAVDLAGSELTEYRTETKDALEWIAERWSAFLEEYYGVSALFLEEASGDEEVIRCVWELTWERDGELLSCLFTLEQREEMLLLNVD